MNIAASGRAALVVAAGLWISASGPLHATENDTQGSQPVTAVGSAVDTSVDPAKTTRHHSRKTASKSHKSDRVAAKNAKKSSDDDSAKADDAKPDTSENAISPAVANANAQWPSDTTTTTTTNTANTDTTNMTSQAGSALTQIGGQPEQPATAAPDNQASNLQVVASDQLNDLDRAATESKPPLTLAKATIDAPAPEAASTSNSPWDQTSMIGKIFIAFGGLLTMASAARMFMA